MRKLLGALPVGLLACFMWLGALLGAAQADGVDGVIIVAACGTPPTTLTPWTSAMPTLGIITVDTTGKTCVNATVSASVSGFQGNGQFGNLTATASPSASTALPTGSSTRITNASSTATVSCTEAAGTATGAVSNIIIPPLSSVSRVNGSFTNISCIDQTGSTGSNLVVLEGGSGLGNDTGGGGGSSGGGGNVNITGINGSTPGLTVPLWVTPATGATWSITAASGAIVDGGDVAQGHIADTACPVSGTATVVGCVRTIANGGQYPAGATAITASATGTTGATTATLAGVASKTMYLCSYSVRANATANANVQNTITGIISGPRTDQMWVPANTAGLGVDEQIFNPCIPASAVNTSIAVASGAPGTGGNVTVNVAGFYY